MQDDEVLAQLRHCLDTPHQFDQVPAQHALREAAVLVPLLHREQGLTMLLTQRTDHLHDHAGQISFPGGRRDEGDASVVATALREAEEEIGLPPQHVSILGCLPEYQTVTGFAIAPIVGLVTPPAQWSLDAFEVASVFEVPLSFLLNPEYHERHQREYQGVMRAFWSMQWQDHYIWGATAGMIVSLYERLHGKTGAITEAG